MANEDNNACTDATFHMARDHGDNITLDSMRDEITEIFATRDSFEEPRVTIPAVSWGDSVEEGFAVLMMNQRTSLQHLSLLILL